MSAGKIPLSVLKERVEPLTHNRFSTRLRSFIYDVASGTFPRQLAKELANKATVQYAHEGDMEFVKCIQWLAVIAEQYGSAAARQTVDEILS